MGSPDGWEVHPDGVLDLIVPVPALCAHWENLKSMSRRAQLDSGHRQCGGPSARINRVALSGSDCGLTVAGIVEAVDGTGPTLRSARVRPGGAASTPEPSALRLLQFLTREGPSRSKATRLRSRRPKERAGPPVWGSRCRVTAHRRGLRQGLGGHLRQPVFTGVSNTVPASSSNEAKRAAQ